MIGVSDFFQYGRDHLLPKQPCSLYRYMEHLVEICIQRKNRFGTILEIGPGTDSIFKYLRPSDYKQGTILDYSPEVVNFCKQNLSQENMEYLLMDVTDHEKVVALNQKWDYIVCNSILEHLEDDHQFVKTMHAILADDGIIVCSTVLHKWLYNEWDHAVGHYRRYTSQELKELFAAFKDVQIIQTSLLQELVRPLFFNRIKHLQANTIEENNRLTGTGHLQWGKPPYARFFPVLRYLMPLYLLFDWVQHTVLGGIVFVAAQK